MGIPRYFNKNPSLAMTVFGAAMVVCTFAVQSAGSIFQAVARVLTSGLSSSIFVDKEYLLILVL